MPLPETCASTASVIVASMCRGQSITAAPAYSACSSAQSNVASGHSTRLARRDHITARCASASVPWALTPATVAVARLQPNAMSSSASRYSRPLPQLAKKSISAGPSAQRGQQRAEGFGAVANARRQAMTVVDQQQARLSRARPFHDLRGIDQFVVPAVDDGYRDALRGVHV